MIAVKSLSLYYDAFAEYISFPFIPHYCYRGGCFTILYCGAYSGSLPQICPGFIQYLMRCRGCPESSILKLSQLIINLDKSPGIDIF